MATEHDDSVRRGFCVVAGLAASAEALALICLAWQLRPKTRVSARFSPQRFEEIALGSTEQDVVQAIGNPFKVSVETSDEEWCFGHRWSHNLTWLLRLGQDLGSEPNCVFFDASGRVKSIQPGADDGAVPLRLVGARKADVADSLGPPLFMLPGGWRRTMWFSEQETPRSSYRVYAVIFDKTGLVGAKLSYVYAD